MKFVAAAKDLAGIVTIAGVAVKRQQVPILKCVKISAKENRLTSQGTDLDMWMHAKCKAAVSSAGEVCVDFADLQATVARMRGEVAGEIEGNYLKLEARGARILLPTVSQSMPAVSPPGEEVEIEGGIEAYKSCLPFVAGDEVRPHLQGVCFDGSSAVATNGLQFHVRPCAGGHGQIVPASAFRAISKAGGRLFLSESKWRAEAEGVSAIGKLIDGTFPEWSRINFEAPHFAKLVADDLIDAIEMATAGRAEWIFIQCKDGKMLASGDRFPGAHIESECPVPFTGEGSDFVGSRRQFIDCLKPFEGQQILLSSNGNQMKIAPENDASFSMVMLMRDARNRFEKAA